MHIQDIDAKNIQVRLIKLEQAQLIISLINKVRVIHSAYNLNTIKLNRVDLITSSAQLSKLSCIKVLQRKF